MYEKGKCHGFSIEIRERSGLLYGDRGRRWREVAVVGLMRGIYRMDRQSIQGDSAVPIR